MTWYVSSFMRVVTDRDRISLDELSRLRPSFGNRSRGIDDPVTREKVGAIVRELVSR